MDNLGSVVSFMALGFDRRRRRQFDSPVAGCRAGAFSRPVAHGPSYRSVRQWSLTILSNGQNEQATGQKGGQSASGLVLEL